MWGFRRAGAAGVAALIALAAAPPALAGDVEHLSYRFGPISVAPGQNLIQLAPDAEKPNRDGYIIRMKPGLVRADGTSPKVTVTHLHHGVWLNTGRPDATGGSPWDRFFATGEEKTIFRIPDGYGYPSRAADQWVMNHMIHNLTTSSDTLWITYDIDFVPADSDLGRRMKPVRPIWLDVRNGEAYPVFDVNRGAGSGGTFTYPDDAPNPYGGTPPRNEWTVDRDGTLVAVAGHVHPGGLWTDLRTERKGAVARSKAVEDRARLLERRRLHRLHVAGHRRIARLRAAEQARAHRVLHAKLAGLRRRAARRIAGPTPALYARVRVLERRRIAAERRKGLRALSRYSGRERTRRKRALLRKLARLRAAVDTLLREEHRPLLFRSHAKYYDPRGPVSWDMSMEGSDPGWRVHVRKGDKLDVSATYENKLASWYESMGIMVAYMADDSSGVDPFEHQVDTQGQVTHGPLPENSDRGSGEETGLGDATTFPDGQTLDRNIGITGFSYLPGDLTGGGDLRNPPVVHAGGSLRFENLDANAQVFHSITACKPPCNRSAGIGYPLANGDVDFDSGQLGYGPPGLTAAANRTSWQTPSTLKPGTYTFFCRIHPFMRGSLRVVK